ncbi:uncharacterized protein LY89DRAFT_723196 [Mollisia scopiformis]|uniref:Arrestin-like N-terminal domain-containing protein n=1 Tax=Mollisia scopiformis TaxID=149040 RepID=A0A194WTX6_MOLSC|nr:uncharacterized protein LY89DRAFT_723196 [Mollisia scopiformis]KUJ11396.1 hypothetical protein LY89DRAFT_723196 [Mollisia scopiformis]
MSFQIEIDNHHYSNIYYPGDTITGVLHLQGPLNDPTISITASLIGKSSTFITLARSVFSEDTKLFEETSTLFEGPCYLESGAETAFGFSFQFPEKTDKINRSGYVDWTQDGHVLPPSVDSAGSGEGPVFVRGSCAGKISYELHARLKKGKRFSCNVRRKIELTVRRPDEIAASRDDLAAIEIPLRRPKPRSGDQRRPLFIWLDDLIGFNGLPSGMSLRLHTPSVLKLDTAVHMGLELIHSDKSSNPLLSQVRILGVEHKIVCKTWARAYEYQDSHTETRTFGYKKMGRTLHLDETIDLTEDLDVVLDGNVYTPHFESYNITRRYSTKTIVKVDFGGRKHKITFELPMLNVLPSEKQCYIALEKEKSVYIESSKQSCILFDCCVLG